MIKVSSEKITSSTAVGVSLDSYFALVDEQALLANATPVTGVMESLQYLSRAIVQEPKNLRLHTQRIFLLLRQVQINKPALASAIADLFIVLGEGGAALKERMLELSKDHLQAGDWLYLKQNEQRGFTANTPITQRSKSFTLSVLSNGLIGHTELISRKQEHQSGSASVSDLHEQALMCLEYGQLEVALELLEQARAEDPTNDEISVDLLSIYISLGMKEEQEALTQELQINID